MSIKRFKSCFIVDVSISSSDIVLTDSSHISYHLNPIDNVLKKEFTTWFKTVFQKGVAQTLTIFEYMKKDISDCESELYIVKFLNLQSELI